MKEAETAAQLSHPNIVPDLQRRRARRSCLLRHGVRGRREPRRRGFIRRAGWTATEARRILKEVAEAFAYAHERGVVHRDIKPDNILLCADDDGRVMVTDFGIARAVTEGADSRLTATGMAIGTPAYMSPEQSMGERDIDGRSDLYALGVVGYQMLAGELPFNAPSTPALLVKQISERPTPVDVHRPDAPPDLARAIMLLLEKDPANRFPSADALVTALDTGDVPELPSSSFTQEPNRLASIPTQSRDSWSVSGGDGHRFGHGRRSDPRWRDEKVVAFRKKLAPFFAVSAVITVLAIFGVLNADGRGRNLERVPGLPVRQALDRRIRLARRVQAAEGSAVLRRRGGIDRRFPRAVRQEEARGGARARPPASAQVEPTPIRRQLGATAALRPRFLPRISLAFRPTYAAKVRDAARHRDDILRLIETLPKREREQVEEVPATADALYRRIELLAGDLTELDRGFAVRMTATRSNARSSSSRLRPTHWTVEARSEFGGSRF